MQTQYFISQNIHRVTTYNDGAFVCVDVYSSKHAAAPVQTKYFPAGSTAPVALFAARSDAAKWVAQLTDGLEVGRA
jgi:hypothetical protein